MAQARWLKLSSNAKLWPKLACAFDLPWLTHDTDAHKERLARLIFAYLDGDSLPHAIVDMET